MSGIDVLDGLTSLADHHLVRPVDDPESEPRFTMLETVREFALEQLVASGEADVIRGRHAAWCLDVGGESRDPHTGRAGAGALARPARGRTPQPARGPRVVGQTGDTEAMLRLAGALGGLWFQRSHREGSAWLERALAAADTTPTVGRGKALRILGPARHVAREHARGRLRGRERRGLDRTGGCLARRRGADGPGPDPGVPDRLRAGDPAAGGVGQGVGRVGGPRPRRRCPVLPGAGRAGSRRRPAGRRPLRGGAEPVPPGWRTRGGSPSPCTSSARWPPCGATRRPPPPTTPKAWPEPAPRENLVGKLVAAARLAAVGGHAEAAARVFGAAEALADTIGYVRRRPEQERLERDAAVARAALGDAGFEASMGGGPGTAGRASRG